MIGERNTEPHLSFEELGTAINGYQEKSWEYSSALLVNRTHDEEGFATITGQDLEDWKKKFPRIDDEEVARLQCEEEAAKEQLMSELGLESPDIISPLLNVYRTERSRRVLEHEIGQNERDPFRTGITIDSLHMDHRALISGVVAMAQITGETYVTHTGIKQGGTYLFVYVNIEPSSAVDEIVARYNKRGLLLSETEAS